MPRTVVKGRRRVAFRPSGINVSRFARKRRTIYNPRPTFTETVDFGHFQTTGGTYAGQLVCTLNSISQMGSYRNLYNQARIMRVQYIIMPSFTEYSPQADISAATLSVSTPRFVYSIQDTPNVAPPVSEIDVLTDNGSKIRQFTRPLKIAHRPVPFLSQTETGPVGSALASISRKYQWLNLNEASGINALHGAVNYFVTQDSYNSANPQTQWNIYAKITFQLQDPK